MKDVWETYLIYEKLEDDLILIETCSFNFKGSCAITDFNYINISEKHKGVTHVNTVIRLERG
jgi:hypothetical protein